MIYLGNGEFSFSWKESWTFFRVGDDDGVPRGGRLRQDDSELIEAARRMIATPEMLLQSFFCSVPRCRSSANVPLGWTDDEDDRMTRDRRVALWATYNYAASQIRPAGLSLKPKKYKVSLKVSKES